MASVRSMRDPAYFVLASLLGGPLCGSAIIERAEEMSDGRVRLVTGTLYTVIDRLTAEGYLCRAGVETVAGRARRRYGLTLSGLSALRAGDALRTRGAGLVTRAGGQTVGRIVTISGCVRVGGKVRAE